MGDATGDGRLVRQARRRWRNGRWEVWHPYVLPDAAQRTGSVTSHGGALADLAHSAGEMAAPWETYPESRGEFFAIGERPVAVGERVWVDEYGADFEVGDPQETYMAFTSGGCHVFAAVAHDETGWPVVAYGYRECVNGCPSEGFYDAVESGDGEWSGSWCHCAMSHFYVRDPEGGLWDVTGVTDEEALLQTMDEFQIREVPDGVFAVVLEGWGSSPELVGWARRQVVDGGFEGDEYSLFPS